MSITFIIGNGFDKALGKKTSYQDFYNWLKNQPTSSNPFIEEMKKSIYGDYENWADFEVGIGNFTEKFKDSDGSQNALSNAIAWKREVDRLLSVYLKNEESSNDVDNIIASFRNIQELWDFLFATALFLNMSNISATPHKRDIHFISLNYTDYLDQIVKKLSGFQINNPLIRINDTVLHPHGKLSTQIVLGVNDSFDFKNDDLIERPENWELKGLIQKQSFIEANIGTSCERRCLGYISNSNTVCIYGASLGQTDEYWWNILADWIQKDKQRRLIIFWYYPGSGKSKEQITSDIQNVFLCRLSLTEEETKELAQRIIVYFHRREYLFSSQQKQVFLLGNGIKIPMVFVEAGSYTMSQKDGKNNPNEKEHTAVLMKDFYIGETPVTQEQYKAVMGNNPSKNIGEKFPVEQVTWYEAMSFCAKLNEKNLAPSGYHFTLPTETQWEFAARGGRKSQGYIYSGSDNADEVAWFGTEKDISHPVGQKKSNELGLYDMSGNVWEWCLDDYVDDNSQATPEFSRTNDDTSSTNRVDRGGAHDCGQKYARVSSRSNYAPDGKRFSIGFRIVLVADK